MILAIDQSFSDTGLCYISKDGRIEATHVKTTSNIPFEARLDIILNAIDGYLSLAFVEMDNPSPVKHVVIEGFAYSQYGRVFELGGLAGAIKMHCHNKGLDAFSMLIQHPKQYVAGNGSTDKKSIIKALENRFGFTGLTNDNIADAIAIGITYAAYIKWKKSSKPDKYDTIYTSSVMGSIDRMAERQLEALNNAENHKNKPKRKSRKSTEPNKFYFKLSKTKKVNANVPTFYID